MQNTDSSNFRFSTPISIRWNDLDALGHVNNIYYFEYFQIARGSYMPTASPQWNWLKNMFVIAHLECDFLREITLKSMNVVVKIKTNKISNKSFEMDYLVVSTETNGSEIIHAKGKSINVMIDSTTKKSIEIPDWLRKDLTNYDVLQN